MERDLELEPERKLAQRNINRRYSVRARATLGNDDELLRGSALGDRRRRIMFVVVPPPPRDRRLVVVLVDITLRSSVLRPHEA